MALQISSGQTFSRLTAVRLIGRVGKKFRVWSFRCICGNEHTSPASAVVSGRLKSCGCQKIDSATKHGFMLGGNGEKEKSMSQEVRKVYRAWVNMRSRCSDSGCKSFARYGGRGIRVCDRWMESFANFFDDVGMPPSKIHSIGRVDNDGNYEPDNVRWETARQQQQNRRTSRMVTINGETLCAREWARRMRIPYETFLYRVRNGDVGNRLIRPVQIRRNQAAI